MPAQMVDPADMQLKPLPTVLALTDGRTFQGDADQSIGVLAGWLIPQDIRPVAEGFIRRFGNPPWQNMGDGTAAPVFTDIAQADIDIANAEALARAQAASLPMRQAIATLQSEYVAYTRAFCAASGIDPAVNVLTVDQIGGAIQAAGIGSALANSLTTLSLALEAFRTRLIEATGDTHALDAIPLTGDITIPQA